MLYTYHQNDMKYILTILKAHDEKWTKQISLSDTKLDEGLAGKEENYQIQLRL